MHMGGFEPTRAVESGASSESSVLSCDFCRQRRVRCDRNKPSCGRCAAERVPCQYASARRNRRQELEHQLILAVEENRRLQTMLGDRSETSSSGDDAMQLVTTSTESEGSPDDISLLLKQRYDRLTHIYNVIHDCDPEHLSQVLNAVQNSVSLDDVTRSIHKDVISHTPLAGLLYRNARASVSPKRHLKPLHFKPLCTVPAAPWTDIITDDLTVSHLVSLYFTWDQPVVNILEKRWFMKDMQDGRERFCCPMLLTAILATACPLHFSLDAPWDKREADQLQMRLLDKARSMWEIEKVHPSVTKVQAAILLTCVEAARGRDKVGMEYFREGLHMAMDIGLDRPSLDHLVNEDDPVEEENARQGLAYCAWGIFNCQSYVAQLMHTVPVWNHPPLVEFPYACDETMDYEAWTPYPFSQPAQESHLYTSLRSSLGFYSIVHRLITMLSKYERGGERPAETVLESLYAELVEWEVSLPSCLHLKINTTPHNILLRITYHLVTINLCRTLRSEDEENITAESTGYAAVHYQAKCHLRDLVCLYFSCHGWKSATSFLYQSLYAIFAECLQYVGDQDQRWRNCINLCVSGIWHLSFSYPFCRALLRLVVLIIREQDLAPDDLSPTTWRILDTFENKVWTNRDLTMLKSIYPVSAEPKRPEDGKAELETVLKAWESLKLS